MNININEHMYIYMLRALLLSYKCVIQPECPLAVTVGITVSLA